MSTWRLRSRTNRQADKGRGALVVAHHAASFGSARLAKAWPQQTTRTRAIPDDLDDASSLSLADRVAVITGGASGIGLACARLMHARGARIAVVDKDEAALACIAEGERLMTVNADNRSVPSIAAGCAAVLAREPRIDIVVNCAGISGFSRPIAAIDEDDFDAMLATHVKGAFFWVRQALPHMPNGGRIINVASDLSMTGFAAMSHYVAAKSALLGLTKAWAREFAPRAITVNAVAPGLIATPMTRGSIGDAVLTERGARVPLGRLARAEEIAFAVAWLASREAAMMTGQTVSPNGGNAIVGF